MSKKSFDFISHGLIHRDELSVTLQLWRGVSTAAANAKPKPESPGIRKTDSPVNPKHIGASLEFTNVSSREVHVISRFWFIRLDVKVDQKPMKYIGPMVSLGPPNESDFATLKPGEKFTTEPTILNNYYGLADEFDGTLEVSFQYSSEVPTAVATLPAG
ncbi:MAG: hypothetical protein U1E10_05385 [Bdellovibrionales bacterium]|nr:hypothetical protein [Bdellovibrionales bacterium]